MGGVGLTGLVALLLLPLAAMADGVSIDFESGWQPITVAAGKPSKMSGEQVPPLVENSSSWADVDLTAQRLTVEPYAGQAAWRVNVAAIRDGRAQLYLPGLAFQPGQYLRLRAAVRSPQSANLDLAIRLQGEPWTAPWQRTVIAGPEWRELDFIIPPIRRQPNEPYALIIGLGLGTYDFDNLSLEYVSEDQLAAGGEPKPGNLCPHSVFPAGLPSPWSLSARHLGARAEPDPANPGPSGQPSLHLVPGRDNAMMPKTWGVSLISPPMPLNGLRTHTISFWAKGRPDQQVQVSLGPPQQASLAGRVTFSGEWQRLSVSGRLPLLPDGYAQLTLTASAEFWLERLQIEEAAQPSEYQPVAPVELSLTPVKPYSLFFESEPLQVRVTAVGTLDGLKLQGSLECVGGPTIELPAHQLGQASRTMTLGGLGESPLGTYRLELQAVDAAGKAQSGWQEIVLARVHRPRHLDSDAPDSPFGVHINAVPAEAAMVKALGFNWVRIHDAAAELTKWYFLEGQPGQWDWSDADAGIDLFRANHLMILGMLDTAPTFRSDCPPGGIGWHSKYFLPKLTERDAWSDYCTRTVQRYRDRVGIWEVWNEPYIRSFFQLKRDPAKPNEVVSGTPSDYAPLLRTAYAAAKQADPACKVIWADQPGDWHAGGVAEKLDQVADTHSFHAYIGAQPNAWPDIQQRVDGLRAGLNADWQSRATWNTEGGTGGQMMQSILRRTPPFDRFQTAVLDADFLVRYELACLAAGVDKFFLYTYHKWSWSPDWNHRLPDGSLAPNATALSNLMWQVEGMKCVGVRDLNPVKVVQFEGHGERVAVLLPMRPAPVPPRMEDNIELLYLMPTDWRAVDIDGNPVAPQTDLRSGICYLRGTPAQIEQWLSKLAI